MFDRFDLWFDALLKEAAGRTLFRILQIWFDALKEAGRTIRNWEDEKGKRGKENTFNFCIFILNFLFYIIGVNHQQSTFVK